MHLDILFKGGRVKRYHTETLIGQQNVAEHSWGLVLLIDRIWPDASKELLLAGLYHDAHEATLGDIPAPTKRALAEQCGSALKRMEWEFHKKAEIPYDGSLGSLDTIKLKVADYLELVLFCQHQYKMGNGLLLQVESNGKQYVKDIFIANPSLIKDMDQSTINYIYDILNIRELNKEAS